VFVWLRWAVRPSVAPVDFARRCHVCEAAFVVCLCSVREPTYGRAGRLSAGVRDAMERAAEFLLACQFPSGAINDRLPDPLAALSAARPSRRLHFRLRGGADVWHTTSAITALRCTGRSNRAAEGFVRSKLSDSGELSYWSAFPGLCIETCSAAFQALPSERARLGATIVRHALPGGRWPNAIVPAAGGYDVYSTGPSVTAWALGTLGREHASLARVGRRYLEETRVEGGLWRAHPAFYATPFYPAHLAIRFAPSQTVRAEIVAATLARQTESGGWGFSADGKPSALPTALALSTVVFGGVRTPTTARALKRAAGWLVANQTRKGFFRLSPAPAVVFYAGPVYATCVALTALAGAAEVL
jgi:hypothetical protein